MKTAIESFPQSLRDLYSHPEFVPFGSSSDDWINDPDRMERCHEAAEHGCDGSTHAEVIQDWRDFLDTLEKDARRSCETDAEETALEETVARITEEIYSCEAWHKANGSLYMEIE